MNFRLFLIVSGLILYISAFSQTNIRKDLQLLASPPVPVPQPTSDPYWNSNLNNKKPIEYKRRGFARYNPVSIVLSGTMLFYQHLISPQLSANCIYQRSCSNFAKQAIKELGLIGGILAASDRLLRCNSGGLKETPVLYKDENGKLVDEPHHHFHY